MKKLKIKDEDLKWLLKHSEGSPYTITISVEFVDTKNEEEEGDE